MKQSTRFNSYSISGFTIVELLIVIVVIAILAAITIVAYNGVQNSAQTSAAQSAVSSGWKKLETYKVQNNSYPISLSDAGLIAANYNYRTYNDGQIACLSSTVDGKSYQINTTNSVLEYGDCINIAIDVWARTSTTLSAGIPTDKPSISGIRVGDLNQSYMTDGPITGGPINYFIATYRAYLNPPVTGTYTISELTDDGGQVYIDGALIVDGWSAGSTVKVSGTIDLVAGKRVSIVYLTKEISGGYSISLRWAYPGQVEVMIPSSAFNS